MINKRFGVHPISVHTLHRGANLVGLRLVCFGNVDRDMASLLYEWKKFTNNSNSVSFAPSIYQSFASTYNVPMFFIDLGSRSITDIITRNNIDKLNLVGVPYTSDTKNCLKYNSGQEKEFMSYLYKLCPQLAMPFVNLGIAGLGVSDRDTDVRVLSNGTAPLCYLKKSVLKRLLSGDKKLENNLLKIGTLESKMVLLEGRGRHIPANIGIELSINLCSGLVTLYVGTISGTKLTCLTQTFESRVFEWVTTQNNVYTGVCGVKQYQHQ